MTCRHAAANRSCQARFCSREAGGSSRGCGSISATTTTEGRSTDQPKASRVLGDVRLLDHATDEQVAEEVALVLVLDGADRALPGDEQGRDDGDPLEGVHVLLADRLVEAQAHQPGQVGAAGGDPQAADLAALERQPALAIRSTRSRPVVSTSRAPASACRAPSVSAEARSRPSVEVNATSTPSTAAVSSAICWRSPPSSTMWLRAVCSASIRASTSRGGVSGYQHLGPSSRDRWHNLTAAKSNGAR